MHNAVYPYDIKWKKVDSHFLSCLQSCSLGKLWWRRMSKGKRKSFLEDLKDSAKKPFESRTKKSKKPSKNDITALYNKMPNYLTLSKLSASYGIYPYLDPLSVEWVYHMSQLNLPVWWVDGVCFSEYNRFIKQSVLHLDFLVKIDQIFLCKPFPSITKSVFL